jgi:hypothetical protein
MRSDGVAADDGRLLLRHVLAQALILAGVTLRMKSRHLGFEHAAHLEHLARLVDGGRGDEGAAGRLHLHQPVLRQLEQGLPHQRARDAEVVGQLLLRQLGARLQPVLDDRRSARRR